MISDSEMLNKKSIPSTAVASDKNTTHSASKRARSESYDSKRPSDAGGPSGDTVHSSNDTQRRLKLASQTSKSTSRRLTPKKFNWRRIRERNASKSSFKRCYETAAATSDYEKIVPRQMFAHNQRYVRRWIGRGH